MWSDAEFFLSCQSIYDLLGIISLQEEVHKLIPRALQSVKLKFLLYLAYYKRIASSR